MVSEQELAEQIEAPYLRDPEVVVLTKAGNGEPGYRPVRHDGTPIRPEIVFDMEELEKLCVMQCTLAEIAAWFSCSESAIDKRRARDVEFKAVMERGYAKGRISVRRKQIQILESVDKDGRPTAGAATMGVWLGKNILGQRDAPDIFYELQAARLRAIMQNTMKPESADVAPIITVEFINAGDEGPTST